VARAAASCTGWALWRTLNSRTKFISTGFWTLCALSYLRQAMPTRVHRDQLKISAGPMLVSGRCLESRSAWELSLSLVEGDPLNPKP
jgi:hypothetical protein